MKSGETRDRDLLQTQTRRYPAITPNSALTSISIRKMSSREASNMHTCEAWVLEKCRSNSRKGDRTMTSEFEPTMLSTTLRAESFHLFRERAMKTPDGWRAYDLAVETGSGVTNLGVGWTILLWLRGRPKAGTLCIGSSSA